MADTPDPEQHRLLGGRLCLDFTNTLGGRVGAAPEEYLPDYDALVRWTRHAGALAAQRAERLRRAAERWPEEAQAMLRRTLALREALFAVFAAATRGEAAPARDLALVNRELTETMRRARLVPQGVGGYRWEWPEDDGAASAKGALESVLWPIVRSAAELLTAPELARVRQCGGPDCGWLFLDTSKNGSRHWCSMEGCGNRAKARRHYARQRSSRD